MRPSYKLDWLGSDLALDTMRQVVNFYDLVMQTAGDLGIVDEMAKANPNKGAEAIIAALYAGTSCHLALKQTDVQYNKLKAELDKLKANKPASVAVVE